MALNKYSSLILRLGLAFVVLWFSINQLIGPSKWVNLVPESLQFASPITLVYINAIIEVIIGVLLILGLFTRVVALVLSLHLIPIIFALGYSPNAIRDAGLLIASLSLAFSGSDFLSIDNKIKKRKNE